MKNHFAESVELRQQAKTKIPIKYQLKEKGIKIITPTQMLQKLPIALTQVIYIYIYIYIIHQKNC